MTPLEAYDLARFLPGAIAFLQETEAQLELPAQERGWLQAARTLLSEALVGTEVQLAQSRNLPELPLLRGEWLAARQQAFVDALEALQTIAVTEGGERSPLLETLLPGIKLPALRKAKPEAMRDFITDFRKRAQSGYATRQLEGSNFAGTAAALHEAHAKGSEWLSADSASPLEDTAADSARATLVAMGATLGRRWQQARLLVEASLLAAPDGAERLRALPRPKRRASPRVSGAAEDAG